MSNSDRVRMSQTPDHLKFGQSTPASVLLPHQTQTEHTCSRHFTLFECTFPGHLTVSNSDCVDFLSLSADTLPCLNAPLLATLPCQTLTGRTSSAGPEVPAAPQCSLPAPCTCPAPATTHSLTHTHTHTHTHTQPHTMRTVHTAMHVCTHTHTHSLTQ